MPRNTRQLAVFTAFPITTVWNNFDLDRSYARWLIYLGLAWGEGSPNGSRCTAAPPLHSSTIPH